MSTSDSIAERAVLFADIAGSTRLYEALGDAEALQRVEACLSALRSVTTQFGGTVVKTIGDEVLCVFGDAGTALRAAAQMQGSVRALPGKDDVRPAVRIGFHTGPVLERDGDVFGDTVNVAARIAGLAKAHQILSSDSTCETLPGYLRMSVRSLGETALKGRSGAVGLCEVIWDLGQDMTLVEGVAPAVSTAARELMLSCGDREWRLTQGALGIGRDAASDIVVAAPRASRQHARIEVRNGKFVLVDLSSNGTFVRPTGAELVLLKREDYVLAGRGLIGFGDEVSDPGPNVLAYECASVTGPDGA
ncbi:MAG: FHA domain-containing protein [Burkholderiales bacterium]|nr:FHA domain-containing protein [Burkholderiales bacterium]